jgi:hypothetical protein
MQEVSHRMAVRWGGAEGSESGKEQWEVRSGFPSVEHNLTRKLPPAWISSPVDGACPVHRGGRSLGNPCGFRGANRLTCRVPGRGVPGTTGRLFGVGLL